LRSGWSNVVKGKQSPAIAGKPSGKQHASSKGSKADRTMSDAATEMSQATSTSSQASPSKGKQPSSSEASSSSSGASKDFTHPEQQAEADNPKSQPAPSTDSGKAAEAAEEPKDASSSDTTEVRLHSCIVTSLALFACSSRPYYGKYC
jgi:cobalamin biosynthesis Mg chelatase CobN